MAKEYLTMLARWSYMGEKVTGASWIVITTNNLMQNAFSKLKCTQNVSFLRQ